MSMPRVLVNVITRKATCRHLPSWSRSIFELPAPPWPQAQPVAGPARRAAGEPVTQPTIEQDPGDGGVRRRRRCPAFLREDQLPFLMRWIPTTRSMKPASLNGHVSAGDRLMGSGSVLVYSPRMVTIRRERSARCLRQSSALILREVIAISRTSRLLRRRRSAMTGDAARPSTRAARRSAHRCQRCRRRRRRTPRPRRAGTGW
jgi:hypothetical protein